MVRGTSATTGGDDGDDGDGITGDTNFDDFIRDLEDNGNIRMNAFGNRDLNLCPRGGTVVSEDGIHFRLQIETRDFPIDGDIGAFSMLSDDTRIGFFTDEGGFRQISFDDVGDYQYRYATNMGVDIIVICRN